MAKSKYVSLFYQFLVAAQDPKSTKGRLGIDAVDERILEELAASWSSKTPITVLEIMNKVAFVSTTTAHRRLKSLKKSGLIDLELRDEDNRVKNVVPTEKTLQHFDFLGRCMVMACKSENKE